MPKTVLAGITYFYYKEKLKSMIIKIEELSEMIKKLEPKL